MRDHVDHAQGVFAHFIDDGVVGFGRAASLETEFDIFVDATEFFVDPSQLFAVDVSDLTVGGGLFNFVRAIVIGVVFVTNLKDQFAGHFTVFT